MDIQVSEYGLNFVIECFRRFQDEGVFFLFFAIAIVLLIVSVKKKWKKGFLFYILMLFMTVFNPLIVTPVIEWLDFDDEYYRLIWLLPVTILLAWMAVSVSERMKRWWMKAAAYVIFFLILAFPGKSILDKGLERSENLYKIPDEVIEICDVLHTDSGEDELRAAMDFSLIVLMGQYDPSIELTITYNDYSFLEWQWETNDNFNEEYPPELTERLKIYRVLYLKDEEAMEGLDFIRALWLTETEYVVMGKGSAVIDYLYDLNLEYIMDTDSYVVMKVPPEDWT